MTLIRDYQLKYNAVKNGIEGLKKKNLLLPRSKGLFHPGMYNKEVKGMEISKFKSWSCNICGINVYGSQKLLVEHSKIHSSKAEIKENEVYQNDYKVYW